MRTFTEGAMAAAVLALSMMGVAVVLVAWSLSAANGRLQAESVVLAKQVKSWDDITAEIKKRCECGNSGTGHGSHGSSGSPAGAVRISPIPE